MLSVLLALASVPSVGIEVGRFNSGDFPDAQKVARHVPQGELTERVERILSAQQCRFDGQNKARFNITVPYAVKLAPSGQAERIVVKDIGCAPIESLVGQVAQQMSARGDFKSQSTVSRWYVSEVYFAKGDSRMAAQDDDPDKVVCKKSEPVLGSRIARRKVCRTVAEWRVHEGDMATFRRELGRGGGQTVE